MKRTFRCKGRHGGLHHRYASGAKPGPASFAHPNLSTVHDCGVDSDARVFLVMELLRMIIAPESIL